MIPISPSILEHHISKFKVGGSTVSAADEAECRKATHILTLGPGGDPGCEKDRPVDSRRIDRAGKTRKLSSE